MNAMKVRKALQRREAEAEMKKILMKNAERYLSEQESLEIERQKYNAMMHVFHVFTLLNSEFGFGKVRLGRLWDAILKANNEFRTGLRDGVGWSKIFGELDRIGFNPIDDEQRRYLETRFQRLYEVGIKHGGEDDISTAEIIKGFGGRNEKDN